VQTSLGRVLVAGTERGLCRISFDEDEADLRRRFPKAEILPADEAFSALAAQLVRLIDAPAESLELPIDVSGTAFQQAVWAALRAIPPGETRTYGEIAAAIGRPGAVRAAGTACGDNVLAVLIPCHRVLRSDGSLGGYAYGVERKKKLLEREKG
jgi:AraC family transcriptional regulator, regulatory protein of adaptative response / methylated-DNA-[protein]-cysteine methyltransferase